MKINSIPSIYSIPSTPSRKSITSTSCGKCGMKWEGAMGYVCSQFDCSMQLQVTSQVSTSTVDFNIESPDPDKRTWYYDGDGTKRRKDE
jgi:hypothetical protein